MHIAFDGTKLKANAALRQSRDRGSLEKEIKCLKEQVRQMIEASTRIDESEEQEHPDGDGSEMAKELWEKEYRLKRLNEARETLEGEKLKRINITDRESRLMQGSRRTIQPSYNGQRGLDAYIPDDFFVALEKKDEFEKRYHIIIYRGKSCKGCAVKEECTKGPARRITRDGRESFAEAMREKLRSEEGREIYEKRLYTVEPVIGNMKWNRRRIMMSLRGLEKVRGEFSLMCLVHNVKKVVKGVLAGSVNLPVKYSGLAHLATLGYREEVPILVPA